MLHHSFKFPAGEVHVKGVYNDSPIYIERKDPNQPLNDYLMECILATSVRKSRGFVSIGWERVELFLPYLPYSRQDRPTSSEEPFSLRVIGDILNTLELTALWTLDVHSDVAYGCVRNLHNISMKPSWFNIPNLREKTLIVPDQGAFKRLSKYFALFNNVAFALKSRDTETGNLKIEKLVGDVSGRNCIIIDDICDGGGTFIQLAKELYNQGAEDIELAVSHGIFSKGLDVLVDAGIHQVYTTDSFPQQEESRFSKYVKVASCKEIFNKNAG